jgi:beta-N-acetylhexosaminidase
MGGHLAYPDILSDVVPSTLSSFFLRKVLRDRLRFDGVVMTDDLEMHGVHQGNLSITEVSRRAFEAGNDMLLLSHTPEFQEQTWREFVSLMGRDEEFRRRVRASARRILLLKARWLKDGFPLIPDPDLVAEKLPDPAAREFFFDSANRAVTLLREEGLPYRPRPDDRILLVGQLDSFFSEGRKRLPQVDSYRFSYLPWEWSDPEERREAVARADDYDTVVFCVANTNSLEVLQALKSFKGRVIVISALSPVYLEQAPWVRTAVAVYGISEDSFAAGFAALAGDFEPEGKLPVDLP